MLERLIPEPLRRSDPKRQAVVENAGEVLNGVLWVLRTGAPWRDLPGRYPSYQTCHMRFQRWVHHGML